MYATHPTFSSRHGMALAATALISLATLICTAPKLEAAALYLDGSGSYVTFLGNSIPSGNQSFTIEAWINPTTIPTGGENGGVITFWGTAGANNQANGFRLRGPTGTRHFFWGNDHDANFLSNGVPVNILGDTTGPFANGWHHLALSYNGSQTVWYWNGNAIGTRTVSGAVNVTAANYFIGMRGGSPAEFFHGYLDEIRIWNRARTAQEIADDMLFALVGNESGLVAYFDFEGSLNDRAGGDNNGTSMGNATIDNAATAPVQGLGPKIIAFTTSTNWIYYGASATLSWAVSNATSVVIDPGIGAVAGTNSLSVSPTNTTVYTLTASNSLGARTATVTINVDPGVPVAQSLTTNLPMNGSVALTLSGRDPNGGTLTYHIVTGPAHGVLNGAPPNLTYTPAADFFGWDTFTFKVNDGVFDSLDATVSLKVLSPPAAPVDILLSSTNVSSRAMPGSIIGLLRVVDPNDTDTHTLTLVPGAADNARFALTNNNVLLAGPSYIAGPGSLFTIRVLATDNTGRSLEKEITFIVVENPRSVVINEIHYNNPDNTVRDSFLELHNPLDSDVDLSLWRIRGGIDYVFPSGVIIPAHGFLVLAENPAVLQARHGVTALGPWDGGIRNEGEEIILRDPANDAIDRVDFKSEFPWPIAANGEGPSMQLVNPDLDNDLGSSWRSATPTPGATNAVHAANAAPNLRQVNHSPNQPASTNSVTITCKVTDPEGVASVRLLYQIVAPGSFIPAILPLTTAQLNNFNLTPALTNQPNPVFEATNNWVTVTMNDDGQNGDAVAGDSIYTVVLPPQAHRTLVRYRIVVADALQVSRRAPFEDDPSLNFAYYVYNGIPAYTTFAPEVLETLPVYTLITRDADLTQCTAWSADQLNQNGPDGVANDGRLYFNWEGAMVFDGVVYDHITYRLRGANGRYHSGKRSFRFKFNPGKYLDAKDQFGQRFPNKWRELTTGKGQSNRGSESFALNEVVNYFLFNKVGVPAPLTLHFHFRVVRGAAEAADQYVNNDFWGLSWAQEKYDVNFLDTHNLPKGNLYKLNDHRVDAAQELRYQGPFAVTNGADFWNIENNLTGTKTAEWLLAHANYDKWYRYHALAEAIRHYDVWPSCNKNGAWYFEPIYTTNNSFLGRMWLLPYDTTDTWGPTWNSGPDVLHNGIFNDVAFTGGDTGENLEMQKEYRNVVREIRDLLFQPDQINAVIDAFAGPLKAFAPADFARWRNAPAPASYSSLILNGSPGAVSGLTGYVQDMKNFMFVGGNNAWWIDRNSVGAGGWVTRLDVVAADMNIPTRPALTYAGTNGYPLDGLVFRSSAFADPNGAGSFAAMQWRVAEVLPANSVVTNISQLRLEWDAAWDSGELSNFTEYMALPAAFLKPERLYRARVRHKNNTGRWSQWSAPVEFRPQAVDVVGALRASLVISEIMYNPPAEPLVDGDEFEFLELQNVGPNPLDLTGLYFSSGINFTFTNGTRLAAGERFLLARNPALLAERYPGVVVNGAYSGRLANEGEELAISHPVAGKILSVTYLDRAPWPVAADGLGFSLVREVSAPAGYAASANRLGTPGAADVPGPNPGVVVNEVLSRTLPPTADAIELFNSSANAVDISGWFLTDDPVYPWKFQIPPGTVLDAGTFITFTETNFNAMPGLGTSFSLSALGDDVYLFSADALGQLTGYSHGFAFGAAPEGVSFGRHINSAGEEQFPLQTELTLNAANAGPRFGPVVISEIHYHPAPGQIAFLELVNYNGLPMPLFDPANPTNTWMVNGVGFTFPTNVTLESGQRVLLVNSDPSVFRSQYNVPTNALIYQFPGGLQNNGELLELLAPDFPATNGVPYYVVDAVRYHDDAPWPLAADGAGASLQRVHLAAYGNDPTNWHAAAVNPGALAPGGTVPVILAGPAAGTFVVGSTLVLSVNAAGAEPLLYQWRFQGGNLAGATNRTYVVPNVQLEASGDYSVVVFNAYGSAESPVAAAVVRVGPSIAQQPTNLLVRIRPDPSALPTTNATFRVTAVTPHPPLTYQWFFNGDLIPDATNSSLVVSNVQLEHEGAYHVVVADEVGPLISQSAMLYPIISPKFTVVPLRPYAVPGELITLHAEAIGNPLPLTWTWRRLTAVISSNVIPDRFSVISFINTNAVGSTLYQVNVRNLTGQTANQTFFIQTVADSDGDGMPDDWESQFGLAANDAGDRNLDADADGLSNWMEYQAGTDPTNPASVLRLELTPGESTNLLSFGVGTNRSYTLQFTATLSTNAWLKLYDVPAGTNAGVLTLPLPVDAASRYYRLITPAVP